MGGKVRWATAGRVGTPSVAYRVVVNAYTEAAIIRREGNDISEEPIT